MANDGDTRAKYNVLDRFAFLDAIETVEVHPSGVYVMREEEQGDFMYIIRSGAVEITFQGQLLDVLERGEVFGEMALVDEQSRSATVVTSTECELIRIDRSQLHEPVRANFDFFKFMMSVVSNRLRRMNAIATMHANAPRAAAEKSSEPKRAAEKSSPKPTKATEREDQPAVEDKLDQNDDDGDRSTEVKW